MTLYDLINNVEFDGDLLVSVYDDEKEAYIIETTDFCDLTAKKKEEIEDLEVSCIYPYHINQYAAIVIELRTE